MYAASHRLLVWLPGEKKRLRELYAAATAGGRAPDWAAIAGQFPDRSVGAVTSFCRNRLKLGKPKR